MRSSSSILVLFSGFLLGFRRFACHGKLISTQMIPHLSLKIHSFIFLSERRALTFLESLILLFSQLSLHLSF